jgi:hypothetical protein
LDDPVDDPVDTDRLSVDTPDDVDAPATDGEFGYLLDEQDYSKFHQVEHEDVPADPAWTEPPPPPGERTFDAFNASTWNFKPSSTPWYRTGRTPTVLVAVTVAVVALVVSVVLLAFRGSSEDDTAPVKSPDASTAPTTATAPPATSAEPPPPPPPPPAPPPPPPTASEIDQPPVYQRPQQRQPTRKPEINVTRSPMSVKPQMPGNKRP